MEPILEIDDFGQSHPNGLGITMQHVAWQALRHRPRRFWVNITKPNNPYREAGHPFNVWDAYFDQPAPDGPTEPCPVELPLDVPLSGHRDWTVERQRAIQPFAQQHFKLRAEIQAEVDSFKAQFFKGRVLACHARGSDKCSEYLPMRPGDMIPQIAAMKERLNCQTVFLMTDDVLYHEQITHAFGACSLTIPRSRLSLHHNPPCGPYMSGKWMAMDAWLAASAEAFCYTPSNSATMPLILGRHEEIMRLNGAKNCVIDPFCQRVDRVLGIIPST